ncbi:MAG: beta-N-acetylhexosaminidase [Sneathiellales bacterium]|nr:beta-N-acetylhexosaminidase [Sneathiellales bacterium]
MQKTDLETVKSVIFSCEGTSLTAEERDFFRSEQPLGLILFARNIDHPEQVRALIEDFKDAVGRVDAPVLVDQEGGRVQRLRSPYWFEAPSFGKLGALYEKDAAAGIEATTFVTRLIAYDLASLGFTVDCSPCLDLSLDVTSSVIGDRSFDGDPERVSSLGKVVMETFLSAGITPVIKHIPGHGRGNVDSHHELPVVKTSRETLSASDFLPFGKLSNCPWGMTAHIVYEDIDPLNPATQSETVIREIVRGEIGFDGLLLTDDLNMQALKGTLAMRAQKALNAGIDIVLHCSGVLAEMKEVVTVCPELTKEAKQRLRAGERLSKSTSLPDAEERREMREALEQLLQRVS